MERPEYDDYNTKNRKSINWDMKDAIHFIKTVLIK